MCMDNDIVANPELLARDSRTSMRTAQLSAPPLQLRASKMGMAAR